MTEYFEAVAVVAALILYLVPSLEADAREHENALAITLMNVLLGWTVIGWFAALRAARSPVNSTRLSQVTKKAQLAVAHATVAKIVTHAQQCAPFSQSRADSRRLSRGACTRV